MMESKIQQRIDFLRDAIASIDEILETSLSVHMKEYIITHMLEDAHLI